MTIFTEKTIDFPVFRTEIKYWSHTLTEYKYDVLRMDHSLQPAKVSYVQGETITAKKLVTVMCSLRAHHRNKVHKQGSTLEEQEAFIKENWEAIAHLVVQKEENFEVASQEAA